MDADGNRIGQLRHKKLDIAPTVYIGTLDDEKKVALKTSGMFNPMNCNAKIEVDGVTVGKIKGNWRAKKFSVVINGVEIATIGRKRTMSSTFMDADSYKIAVRPQGQPVDLAFVSLLAIGLDELEELGELVPLRVADLHVLIDVRGGDVLLVPRVEEVAGGSGHCVCFSRGGVGSVLRVREPSLKNRKS